MNMKINEMNKPLTYEQRKFLDWIVGAEKNMEIKSENGAIWHSTMVGFVNRILECGSYKSNYSYLLNAICKKWKDEYENK